MKDNIHFQEITMDDIKRKKEKHEFEDLSNKIIGAAIEVHRELARPPRLSEPRL